MTSRLTHSASVRRNLLALSSLLCGLMTSAEVPRAVASTEYRTGAPLRHYETLHFRVIYDADDGQELARHIGELAEKIRVEVLETLQLPDPGHYDLLIMDNYDNANGSATGYPINVIRLYLNGAHPPITGSSDLSDAMGETWLRELITHEYTHAVHLNYLTGWTAYYKLLFHSNPLGLVYPSWFVEGLATAVETHNSSRGRGRTASSDMILRTAILDDSFLPLGLWEGSNRWPRGGARYLYGGAFLHYVDERFGPGTFKRILDAANRQLPLVDDLRPGPLTEVLKAFGVSPERAEQARLGGLERAFRLAVGIPLSTLVREFKQDLQLRYTAEARRIQEAGVTRAERLSTEEGSTRSAAVSPDGRLVAYVGAGENELRGIYAVPIQGGKPVHLLKRDDLFGGMSFAPEGDRLIYARLIGTEAPLAREEARTDLFSLDIRTQQEKRLTHGERLRDPAFSPDGRFMVAIQTGGGRTKLLRLEPDGSSPVELFVPDMTYQLSQPSVSPDGRMIALSVFVQQDPPGQSLYQIGLFDLDSGTFRLIPGQGTHREATWLDAQHLLYSSDQSGIYNLYTTDLTDGTVRPVTNMLTGAFQPLVSRRPQDTTSAPTIVFRAYGSRGFGIYRLEPNQYETLALMNAGPNRRVPPLGDRPPLEPGPGRKPQAIEDLRLIPMEVAAASTNDRRYEPLTGMRMSQLAPVLESDEGSASRLVGGYTLGLKTSWIEPLNQHRFSAEVTYGLSSLKPSWTVAYVNQTLNVPLVFYGQESANIADLKTLEDTRYLVWERARGGGMQLALPWTHGRFYAELGGSAALARFERSSLITTEVASGVAASQNLYFSTGIFTSSSWRSPAEGHFLDLSASHRDRWTDPHGLETQSYVLRADYTGRMALGWGNLDVTLTGGQVVGGGDPISMGGFSGSWAFPGVRTSNPIVGPVVGRGLISLSQDLWRPELVLGALPSLALQRLELTATAGYGIALDNKLGYMDSRRALSLELTAWGSAIRSSFELAPSLRFGYDLSTASQTWTVNLSGIPGFLNGATSAYAPRSLAQKRLK